MESFFQAWSAKVWVKYQDPWFKTVSFFLEKSTAHKQVELLTFQNMPFRKATISAFKMLHA